jgi:hypothetical protein
MDIIVETSAIFPDLTEGKECLYSALETAFFTQEFGRCDLFSEPRSLLSMLYVSKIARSWEWWVRVRTTSSKHDPS